MSRFFVPRLVTIFACLWTPAFFGVATAADFLLYDATAGNLPNQQPWLAYGAIGTASQSLVTGGVRLTTDTAAQAGWSNTLPIINTFKNPSFPALNSAEGFAIDWTMQMIAETHVSNDRAGTSMILLGSDNKGIELGFWTDQVWAQTATPLFTKGESANFDTTASVNYRLLIFGDEYSLFAGSSRILTGQTRSYAAFGSAPYTLSNYFFLGDNTTSAAATVNVGSIALVTAVPETKLTGALIVAAAACVIAFGRRRRKTFEFAQ